MLWRKCEEVLIDMWISILDKKVYILGPAGLVHHFKLSRGEGTWKRLPHDLFTPCLICLLSASPLTHTTDHHPLSLISDKNLQHLLLVPFVLLSMSTRVDSSREVF